MPSVNIEGVGVVAFPDDMTPEQITAAIETEIMPQQQSQQRVEQGGASRQVALTGRAAGEGVLGTLLGGAEAFGGLATGSVVQDKLLEQQTGKNRMQLEIADFNRTFGTEVPEAASLPELLSSLLSQAGAPTPETDAEKLRFAGVKGASSALTGGAGASIPNAARAGVSGATGAGTSEFVRQKGGGPVAQFFGGLAGAFVPGAAEQTVRTGASLLKGTVDLAKPLTRSGQERIAGNVLANSATNPQTARAALEKADEILPGSTPTSGPASGDVGLLALEKGVRGKSPAAFGIRESEQNTARQVALEKVAGTADDVKDLQAARNAATTPMREAALASKGAANPTPIVDKIDEILASPKGERAPVKNALTEFRSRFEGKTEPSRLYELRKEIGDAMEGKLGADKSVYRLARSELMDVRKVLDDEIEKAAPGFKAYLERYKELSKPINEKQVLQEIQRRSQSTIADITTQRQFLAPGQFNRAVAAAAKKNKVQLTAEQESTLKAIQADLDLGNAINSRLVKAPGSDTFQNLSIASAMGAAGKEGVHPFVSAITKPLKWLYKEPDEKINQILAEAMLDPKFAADLLKRATPQRVSSFAADLKRRSVAYGSGAAIGVATTQATPERDTPKNTQRQ
jgi:hypothetical protein